MNIGVIGLGVVGKANADGFKKLNHTVLIHDIKLNTNIQDVLDTDVVFVCTQEDNVEQVVKDLFLYNYKGIVAIRSTIQPGTIDNLLERFTLPICYVPEFLKERSALEDFLDCDLLAIGSYNTIHARKIAEVYKNIPKHVEYLTPREAEILKIYNNSYAALRVVFANIMYEVCEKHDADYDIIKTAYEKTGKTTGNYLDVNEDLRGFGGMCLPKDTGKLSKELKKLNLHYDLINAIIDDNKKFKTTIFDGMRK